MEKFIKFVGGLVLYVGACVLAGFTLVMLLEWFINPLFNFRSLSIPEALGVIVVASYLTHQVHSTKDKPYSETFFVMYVKPIAALLLGYIIKLFL